jgi:hypothetical protein
MTVASVIRMKMQKRRQKIANSLYSTRLLALLGFGFKISLSKVKL